jgi:hypothetical protein
MVVSEKIIGEVPRRLGNGDMIYDRVETVSVGDDKTVSTGELRERLLGGGDPE